MKNLWPFGHLVLFFFECHCLYYQTSTEDPTCFVLWYLAISATSAERENILCTDSASTKVNQENRPCFIYSYGKGNDITVTSTTERYHRLRAYNTKTNEIETGNNKVIINFWCCQSLSMNYQTKWGGQRVAFIKDAKKHYAMMCYGSEPARIKLKEHVVVKCLL